LDIAGVDLVVKDVSRPLAEQGGAIVEVNAGPGLLMHLKPAIGKPRPVGEAIVNHLFEATDSGRIPVVGITGSQQTTQLAKLVAWISHLHGRHTGLACEEGVFLDSRQVISRNACNVDLGQHLLINRAVEVAVFENPARSILAEGLPYDRCQVGVVTDLPSPEGLEEFYIKDADQVANVVRTQIDVVLPHGVAVLNAAAPGVPDLARLSDGGVVFYGDEAALNALAHDDEQPRRWVMARGRQVLLVQGEQESALLDLDLPAVARLHEQLQLDTPTLLAAIGTTWALDISPSLIRAGLKTFGQTASGNPSSQRKLG